MVPIDFLVLMMHDSYVRCHHWGKLVMGTFSCTVFVASCESIIISKLKVKKMSNNKIAASVSEYRPSIESAKWVKKILTKSGFPVEFIG